MPYHGTVRCKTQTTLNESHWKWWLAPTVSAVPTVQRCCSARCARPSISQRALPVVLAKCGGQRKHANTQTDAAIGSGRPRAGLGPARRSRRGSASGSASSPRARHAAPLAGHGPARRPLRGSHLALPPRASRRTRRPPLLAALSPLQRVNLETLAPRPRTPRRLSPPLSALGPPWGLLRRPPPLAAFAPPGAPTLRTRRPPLLAALSPLQRLQLRVILLGVTHFNRQIKQTNTTRSDTALRQAIYVA